MALKITLVPNPPPRSIAETVLAFNAYLGIDLSCEVFYTPAGYVGKLPLPGQRTLSLHGVSLPCLRKRLAWANKQWKQLTEQDAATPDSPIPPMGLARANHQGVIHEVDTQVSKI